MVDLRRIPEPIKYREGESILIVNLSPNDPAVPFPTSFKWFKNGSISSNTSRVMFGYPSVIISNIIPSDSGDYSLTATYFNSATETYFDSATETGKFTLDVLCK